MKIIKKIDVWSLAKIQGAIAFAMGLILGLIQWILTVWLGPILQTNLISPKLGETVINSGQLLGLGAFAGLGFIGFVFFAAFIGIMGFLGGAITAYVYNFIAPRIGGGVKIELGDNDQ